MVVPHGTAHSVNGGKGFGDCMIADKLHSLRRWMRGEQMEDTAIRLRAGATHGDRRFRRCVGWDRGNNRVTTDAGGFVTCHEDTLKARETNSRSSSEGTSYDTQRR